MAETGAQQRRDLYYRGTVQGVGFRYTTVRIAVRFAVAGFVQNLPDGRVYLVAEGVPSELDRFLGAIHAALGDYISDTDQAVGPATGQFDKFDVRY